MKRTKKTQIGIFLSVCLLMLGAGAILSRGATEVQVRSSAPPWLSLFGAAVKPDGSIYIVGAKALLLTSTNQGKTWIEQILKERPGSSLFQDRDLYSIRFTPDGNTGWIVGEEGTILYSNDGGKTWTKQQSGTTKNLFKIAVIDPQTALAVGAGALARPPRMRGAVARVVAIRGARLWIKTYPQKGVGGGSCEASPYPDFS